MNYELFHGDALEFMKKMDSSSVDHIITDPPYDERTHSGAVHYSGMVQIGNNDTGIDEFTALLDPGYLAAEFLRISRRWSLAFCTFEDIKKWRDVAWEQKAWVRTGVWDRVNPAPQFSGDRPSQACDAIAIMHNPNVKKAWNGGGRPGIWRFGVEFGKKEHPTQKPLTLMKRLICDFTDEGDTVFDPFMGGGSTGVACMMTGRHFIGCEKKADYFAISERRIKNAAQQMLLF